MWRQVWRRTRGYRAVVLALLLHGLVLLLAHSQAASRSPVTTTASTAPRDTFEVDLAEAPEATAPERQVAALSSLAPSVGGKPATSRQTHSLTAAPPEAPPPTDTEEAAPPSVTATEDVGAEPTQPIDLGIGADGWQRWVASNGSESATVAPDAAKREGQPESKRRARFRAPTASKTGGLQEALEEHDRALGLSPSGRVRTALFQAAHSDVAPQLGVAVFQVTVLRAGGVEVSLSSASGEMAGWEAVAQRAAEELRKKPPRIPPSREGARILVEINAEAVFPNGMKESQQQGLHVEVAPPKFRSTEAMQSKLKELNPVAATTPGESSGTKAIVDLPGIYLAQRGKVCGYRVGLSPLGPILQGGCDLSNIGAKVQRVVHTRVRDESLF